MKERPILFSGPMVRALLRGEKTQTRRAVKHRMGPVEFFGVRGGPDERDPTQWGWYVADDHPYDGGDGHVVLARGKFEPGWVSLPCPYGEPGDMLWVRETWAPCDDLVLDHDLDDPENVAYRADLSARFFDGLQPLDTTHWNWDFVGTREKRGWRPSIFMPRWASRITLEVTDVRVQRVQEISEEDARAEGVSCVDEYEWLWGEINGTGSWDANPWVWAITFKVLP